MLEPAELLHSTSTPGLFIAPWPIWHVLLEPVLMAITMTYCSASEEVSQKAGEAVGFKTPAGATQEGRLFRMGQMETVAVGRVGPWDEGTPGTWQLRAMCLCAYMPSGTGLSSDSASPSLRPNWTPFIYWSHDSPVQKQRYETSVSRWINIELDYLNYPHSLALLPPPLSADAKQLMSIQLMSPGNIGQVCWTRLPANRGACLLAPIRGRGDARGSCMAMSLITLKLCSYAHVLKYSPVRVLSEVHLHCGSGELTCFWSPGFCVGVRFTWRRSLREGLKCLSLLWNQTGSDVIRSVGKHGFVSIQRL